MTDDTGTDLAKMREDLDNAKAANAFLFLALEELGKMAFEAPRMMINQMKTGSVPDAEKASFEASANRLDAMLRRAHECIWDEHGEPR